MLVVGRVVYETGSGGIGGVCPFESVYVYSLGYIK